MNTFSGQLLATALVPAIATGPACAYQLSPPDASVHLHGRMTFNPNEGGGPFTCGVTLDLKTKKGKVAAIKLTKGEGGCENIHFNGLPYYVTIMSHNSGNMSFIGFGSNKGNCVADGNNFKVNKSGLWTFPSGQCLSGILASSPATTIVK